MKVDVKATKEARRQQEAAVRLLRKAFGTGSKGQLFMYLGQQRAQRDTRPWRPRAGCPPYRTPEQKRRHLRRKRARAARRVNRRR